MPSASAPSATVLAADRIGFAYAGGSRILEDVTLEAMPGSVTMIVGRSGSGKTTLLKVLQGLLKPVAGSVHRPRGAGISYIPQGLGLVRNQSALQNVLAGALGRVGTLRSVFGAFPAPVLCEARGLLERVGIAHKEDEIAGNLSGGERQRVAIARALMSRSRFVLADEFVSQLDAVTSLEMLELVRQTVHQGIGWVITTHDLDVASTTADRVIALRGGRVVLDRKKPVPAASELLESIQ